MKMSPKAEVIECFGSKEKLVDELLKRLDRPDSISKDAFKKRLLKQSNSKLLRLHRIYQEIESLHGSREKLIEEIARWRNRDGAEAEAFKQRLSSYGIARLLSLYHQIRSQTAD